MTEIDFGEDMEFIEDPRSTLEVKDKREDRHYRWVHQNNIADRKALGYIVADPDEVSAPNAVAGDAGGAVTNKELVLMEMPEELWKKRKAGKKHLADAQVESAKVQGNEVGLETIKETSRRR